MRTWRTCYRGRMHQGSPAIAALSGVILWSCAAALAQVQYTPPVQQTGRLYEINTQLSAPAYYSARPVSPLIAGNALTTGNVRGGLHFRGYSPISDPSAFRASLGSGALSAFRRDSVSVADSYSGYPGIIGLPYYDPSQTAATTGFLRGQYGQSFGWLGTTTPGVGVSPLPGNDGRVDMRIGARLGQQAGIGAVQPGSLQSQIVGLPPTGSLELGSGIFGPQQQPVRPTGLTAPLAQGDVLSQLANLPSRPESQWQQPGQWRPTTPQDVPGSRPPLGTPLDLVRSGAVQRFTLEPEVSALMTRITPESTIPQGPVGVEWPVGELGTRPPARVDAQLPLDLPQLTDPSVLPGYDVFTDMQLALALSGDPGATWFADMQTAIQEDPVVRDMLLEQAELRAQEFVGQVLSAPITTFHGQGPSEKNNEMLKAEALMELGRYYEAVRRYDVAARLDPLDPLPLIGKGNAYLAAGDYLSASVALVRGFERFPELSKFRLDLPSLIGGLEIVDIRRADLLQRLANQDDARLRFLLGYLEYYSGDAELRSSALLHFERAAQLDLDGTIISRFPHMLRGEGTLPPPKLPGPEPVAPELSPRRVPAGLPLDPGAIGGSGVREPGQPEEP